MVNPLQGILLVGRRPQRKIDRDSQATDPVGRGDKRYGVRANAVACTCCCARRRRPEVRWIRPPPLGSTRRADGRQSPCAHATTGLSPCQTAAVSGDLAPSRAGSCSVCASCGSASRRSCADRHFHGRPAMTSWRDASSRIHIGRLRWERGRRPAIWWNHTPARQNA